MFRRKRHPNQHGWKRQSHGQCLQRKTLTVLVKYEEAYINDYETVRDAKEGIGGYMSFYNWERPHQSLNYKTPAEVYFLSLIHI